MKIKIEQSTQGRGRQNDGRQRCSPSTRRGAETKVLIGDGETSVIGGIFQQTDTSERRRKVFRVFRTLRLIGWLFKIESSSNSRHGD